MAQPESYSFFEAHLKKLADIQFASAVLQWDQETYMPPNGAEIRARQLATLNGLAHSAGIASQLGEWLMELTACRELNEDERVNVHHAMRDFTLRKKYSTAFVEEMSFCVSAAFQSWQEARKASDFSIFASKLEKLMELKLKECDLLGYKHHPYDAMLDLFEPGLTVAQLNPVFDEIRNNLKPVIDRILAAGHVRDDFMYREFNVNRQWDFGVYLLEKMGFDFASGRQDKSMHPFTVHFNNRDVRVTTRMDENNLNEMIWSCIHEGGHALYEQGLLPNYYGMPMAEAVSLGIHESQSRIWENNVGRGLAFWKFHFPVLQKYFPDALQDVSVMDFYKAMNKVSPSLIRTNADELTYHYHVLIRFEIEKLLFERKIQVRELPEYWNAAYKKYLGIDVSDDAHGVLQDVHWSHGSFGYFPTYSLGSFYAAQFYNQAVKEIPGLETMIENGNTQPLLQWLRNSIHVHGKKYAASELCKRITGKTLDAGEFLSYIKNKFGSMLSISWV